MKRMMPDREKVIKALETCANREPGEYTCNKCPYEARVDDDGCEVNLALDALALLKEQEPVEPYADFCGHDVWRCGNCGAAIFYFHNDASDEDEKEFSKFCTHCGKPVKWE